jgi:hypothetical protein
VLTPTRHADLLRREPDLTYAVLMPWIEGPTWVEVMLEKRPLTPQQALDLARAFAQVLVRMEEQGLAHCDLSGPNVLLPMLAGQTADGRPQTACSPSSTVELVDVEGLYAPGLPRPEALPSGSAGYAHRTAREGLWGPTADRFAGAVLLAEMLGWGDESVRQACYGETYFDPAEMPSVAQASACDRYQTLLSALARHYGQPVADLFERAWTSETLADCPTFGEWLVALPEQPVAQAFSLSTPASETTAGEQPTSPQESAAVDATAEIRAFMQAARRMEDKRNLEGALELYRQALELAQADPSLRSLAREIELTVQDVEKRAAYDTQVLKPRRTSPLPAGEGPGVRSSPLPVGEEPEVRPSPLPSGEGEGVRAEGPGVRVKRPWGWLAAGLALFLAMGVGLLWVLSGSPLRAALAPSPTPSFTPYPTYTPYPTATPTPLVLPVLAGTPYPQPNQPISLTNANQVVQLARWGKGTVNQVVFSPDGRLLAVASSLGIYLYDAETLAEIRFIETDAWVLSVAFSPDGRLLASGSGDQTVKLWDVETGQEVRTLSGHTDNVLSVAFSPDGRLLASGSDDQTMKLWDVETGQEVRTLSGHTGRVWSVAFSPDGRLLASGSDDQTVKLWDVATGQEVRTLSGHTSGVVSVAFSPDGRLLASGSWDGTVKLWDVGVATKDFSSPPEVRTLRGHTSWVGAWPSRRMAACWPLALMTTP